MASDDLLERELLERFDPEMTKTPWAPLSVDEIQAALKIHHEAPTFSYSNRGLTLQLAMSILLCSETDRLVRDKLLTKRSNLGHCKGHPALFLFKKTFPKTDEEHDCRLKMGGRGRQMTISGCEFGVELKHGTNKNETG